MRQNLPHIANAKALLVQHLEPPYTVVLTDASSGGAFQDDLIRELVSHREYRSIRKHFKGNNAVLHTAALCS